VQSIGPYQLPNRFILAPMAGVSEMPFRVIAFELGAALCPTELVSARGIFHLNRRTLQYLKHDSAVEKPYSLQLFGGEPEVMAQAAVVAKQHGAQIIDLNMGCPVKKVTKTGSGSALMSDPKRAGEIVRLIREATGLPVTAKIRSGWDHQHKNFLELADALGAQGLTALAVHPRTRAQGYAGKADWNVITELKRHVREAFAVIGNGDVKTVADAHRMLDETGCDFVMIGRGALGNPWLFRQLAGGEGPSPAERAKLVLRHLREHVAYIGAEVPGVKSFRRQLGWYSHGLAGASAFRNAVNRADTLREVEERVDSFFFRADVDLRAPVEEHEVDYRQALG
jgi:tRNA-dihydrouridine synthase B